MENRDREKMDRPSSSSSDDLNRNNDSESSFDPNTNRSDDWNSEPSRSSDSDDLQSDKGRSSSDLGSNRESRNVNRGSFEIEH